MDPYRRQNIFSISTGAFPLFSDITPVYTKRINEGGRNYHPIDIFRSNFNNIEETQISLLFGNHIFYHYSKISEEPFRGDPKEFLEGFFQSHQPAARLRLQAMMFKAGNFVVNNAATYFKSFYTAAPEEALVGAERGGPSYEKLKEARTPGTAAKTADIYSKYAGGTFYEGTKEAANKYAYHHGIFGSAKKIMMVEYALIDRNESLTEAGKYKAKAKSILGYYKRQVKMTFNPIIRNMRSKIPLAMITPHETLAAEMYGILSGIKRGADGYPALSALGHTYDWKTSSVARGRGASTFILHMLGNYLAHGNLYHVLPIDEKNLAVKAIIGRFALMTGPKFPEFDATQLKTAEVVSGLFGTAAGDNNAAVTAAENMDRAHQHGLFLLGKTEGEFRRNEIFNVTKDNIFTNSKKYRVSMNLVAADKDFAEFLVNMLTSLKTAGSSEALTLLRGGLTPPMQQGDIKTKQLYWAVPYLGIYDVEYAEMGKEV